MNLELQSAWAKWNTALRDAAAKVEALTEGRDASERAEGYRFLTRISAAMTEFQMEQSADWPCLVPVMSPARKFYVDNPDTLYHRATLDPQLGYRVHGRRGDELYLSFCVYGLRGRSNAILANACDNELEFKGDGTFELLLSAKRPAGAVNWLPLEGNARTLVTRQYFTSRNQHSAELHIEMLKSQTPPPVPNEKQIARRIRGLTESVTRTLATTEAASALWLQHPNEVSVDSTADDWASLFATPDNDYVGGWYALAEDEALVMEGCAPKCRYWSVQLCSRWLESRDYNSRQVILNHSQVQLESDGTFTIAIAHRDPGWPNWLDTAGQREGGVIFRWLLPVGEWKRPLFKVVRFPDLLVHHT